MTEKKLKRRANLLYRLRRKGVEVVTKERTIHCRQENLERVRNIRQTKILMIEYGFAIKMFIDYN
jgi:hypothetical protein